MQFLAAGGETNTPLAEYPAKNDFSKGPKFESSPFLDPLQKHRNVNQFVNLQQSIHGQGEVTIGLVSCKEAVRFED